MNNVLIIFGSARSNGHTRQLIEELLQHGTAELINLNQQHVEYYSYDRTEIGDDFLAIAEKMVAARIIIFATPVYWFTMSAMMKTFFDRLSDLITIRKDLGRALKGRKIFVLSSSSSKKRPVCFETPFIETAKYLDMQYGGSVHGYITNGNIPQHVQSEIRKMAGAVWPQG